MRSRLNQRTNRTGEEAKKSRIRKRVRDNVRTCVYTLLIISTLQGEAEAYAIEVKAKAEQMSKKADAWKESGLVFIGLLTLYTSG